MTKATDRALSLDYPFDWRGLEDFSYPLDPQGIPQVKISKRAGLRYHPVTIAQYGLFNLQEYHRTRSERCFQIALKTSGWLVDNVRDWSASIGGWVFDFDLDFYGLQASWISGMAQGQGISLLLRVYSGGDGDEHRLAITKRAFQAFLHPVSEGGVVSRFPDGSLVFEEFPTQPPSLVLNGHVFGLLGIHDYATFWGDKGATELFEVAVSGLKKNLERYDTGFWNLYDLHPTRRLASPIYVRVHVQLLKILADLASEPFFHECAARWQRYLASPVSRLRWAAGKLCEKIRLRF